VQRIVHLRANRERHVYVAGPMTGLPEYNFPLFNATAARLRSEGWHVENPAEHGHVDGAGWSDYLRWDISRIATCGAIYLLPGWSKSKGATLEVHIAGVLGLQVLLADGAEAPQADSQPAPEYVGNGMFKGETIQKAAEHWANWCDVRCLTGLSEFLRVVAATPAFWTPEEIAAAKESAKKFEPWLADADRAARAPADNVTAPAATPTAASIAWNALRDLTDPLGEAGVKIMGHVRIYAQRQYEAGLTEGRATPPAQAADSVLEDAARLDWLDQQCEAYGFQDIHEGNRWEISGPYANVRVAIDAERAARKQGGA
jgi:hypothetical protein